jgi:hypothetical protein
VTTGAANHQMRSGRWRRCTTVPAVTDVGSRQPSH